MTLALLLLSTASAVPRATCPSCAPGGDESRDLLYRERADDRLALEWRGALPEARNGGGAPSASAAEARAEEALDPNHPELRWAAELGAVVCGESGAVRLCVEGPPGRRRGDQRGRHEPTMLRQSQPPRPTSS